MHRLICLSSLICGCLFGGSVPAQETGVTFYECVAAGGLTRQIKLEEHCLAERQATPGLDACRVEYTKDGITETLWQARNDPSFCYPRVQTLLRTLETSGFSCTGSDGHISCDDGAALIESMPLQPQSAAQSPNAGRGSVAITPSTRSEATSPEPQPRQDKEVITEVAATEGPQLLREAFFSDVTRNERDYFVYLPAEFTERERWPVMLFLHGDGERGDGKSELDFVMVHGPLYEAWAQKRDLPFVMVAPQLPMYEKGEVSYIKNRKFEDIPWRMADGTPPRAKKFSSSDPMDGSSSKAPGQYPIEGPPWGWALHDKELLGILDNVVENYRGDPDRVYVTGLSYGGFGAWYMASKYPERFAAVNPIVAYAHPDLVDSIAEHKVAVWCFAGGRDKGVPVEYFYAGMNKLEQLGHQDLRFTVEEDMNHDVWTRVYAGEDIYNWMLSQTK